MLPKADVAETDKELVVSIELPGVAENDVKVVIEGDELVVSGERKARTEEKDKHWHRVETSYGAFERRFVLPARVNKDHAAIKATSHKGVVEIHVPKIEPRTPAKIPVKAM
jgi:HSP20 family protein